MRAFRLRAPFDAVVAEVPDPAPGTGEVVVRVRRAGLCGTDRELFDGGLGARLGPVIRLPLTIGHEWSGAVVELGDGVSAEWSGASVTGDTFIGCGVCGLCALGRRASCPDRAEIGVRAGWDGAVAELLRVPAANLRRIPDGVDWAAAAMAEPASNAVRAIAELLPPVRELAVWGAGTIGVIAARVAAARGIRAVIVEPSLDAAARATALGLRVVDPADVAGLDPVDAAINMSAGAGVETAMSALVRPGGTLVTVGFAGGDSRVETRTLVERDQRLIGVLGGPHHLDETLALLGRGELVVDDLIGEPIGLDDVAGALADWSAPRRRPKLQVAP